MAGNVSPRENESSVNTVYWRDEIDREPAVDDDSANELPRPNASPPEIGHDGECAASESVQEPVTKDTASISDMGNAFQLWCEELEAQRRDLEAQRIRVKADGQATEIERASLEQVRKTMEQRRSELADWEMRLKSEEERQQSAYDRKAEQLRDRDGELDQRANALWAQMSQLNEMFEMVNQVVGDEYDKFNQNSRRLNEMTERLVTGNRSAREQIASTCDATALRLQRLQQFKARLKERAASLRNQEIELDHLSRREEVASRVDHTLADASRRPATSWRVTYQALLSVAAIVLTCAALVLGSVVVANLVAPPVWRASAIIPINDPDTVTDQNSWITEQRKVLTGSELASSAFDLLAQRGVNWFANPDDLHAALKQNLRAELSGDKGIELTFVQNDRDSIRNVVDAVGRAYMGNDSSASFLRYAARDSKPIRDDRVRVAGITFCGAFISSH